ncbi:hypothetical protein [Cerasicoccus arenae]|uniref:Uncharacterized protein n=1 Tax=Cerasicoccus arenae TaxID=424488 RepID=A0A8J3DHI3_9BACT|nr:hypothetical protein [Cerasicoccus arenae]MBK1859231.1 hypothetical protein [Cerasicoccus arenae]GHC02746.1 hypothetical protein GCM10007047_19260 [Cerasicoccus arenae]
MASKLLVTALSLIISVSLLQADTMPGSVGIPFAATQNGVNTTDPGQPIIREVTVHNQSNRSLSGTISLSVQVDSEFSEESAPAPSLGELSLPEIGPEADSASMKIEVPANGKKTFEISTEQGIPVGYYFVALSVNLGGATQLLYDHQIVMHESLPELPEDSRFGMNSSNPKYIDNLRRLGVGWIRFENLKWAFVNPSKDEYAFDGSVAPWNVKMDEILAAYKAAGFKMAGYFFQTPWWASSAPEDIKKPRKLVYPPTDNAYYADAVFQTIARYGDVNHPNSALKSKNKKSGLDQLAMLELWNEVNLTNPNWGFWVGSMEQYFEMFRPAAEAGKAADPDVLISHSSYAGLAPELVDQLRTYTYPDGKHPLDFTDIINVHYYSGKSLPETATLDPNANRTGVAVDGARTFEENLIDLDAWRNQFKPEAEIWITETGYDVGGKIGSTLRMHCAKLPRVYLLAFANGVDRIFWYREKGSTPSQHAGAGLIDNDENIRPSWLTMATLIRELDGVGTRDCLVLPHPNKNIRLILWKTRNGPMLTAWAVEGGDSVNLNLGTVTITDAFGNKRRAELNGEWALGDFPVYISDIGDISEVFALKDKALEMKNQAIRSLEESKTLKMYLFDFGTHEYGGLLQGHGLMRPFTTVTKGDRYSSQMGYGFTTSAASDGDRDYDRLAPLTRDITRFKRNTEFKIDVEPGDYEICGYARSGTSDINAIVDGGAGGPLKLTLSAPQGAKPNFEGRVTSRGTPLTIQFDHDVDVAWISIIEIKN